MSAIVNDKPEGFPITQMQLEKLQDQLTKLIRGKNSICKEMGNLTTKSYYDTGEDENTPLKEELGKKLCQIAELKAIMACAEIIDDMIVGKDIVTIKKIVTIRDPSGEFQLTILGPRESNPDAGIISSEAPLALALMDKRQGDVVTCYGWHYKILQITEWQPS